MPSTPKIGHLTIGLLLSMALAACGGRDSTSATASSVTEHSASSPTITEHQSTTSGLETLEGATLFDSTGDAEPDRLQAEIAAAAVTQEPVDIPAAEATQADTIPTPGTTGTANAASDGTPAADEGSTTAEKSALKNAIYPTAAGLSSTSNTYQRLYGPGAFNINALGNTVIGVHNQQQSMVSNRFRATSSGSLAYIRVLMATGAGYSKGNGGTIRVSLYPDDGSSAHLPNQTRVLARTIVRPSLPSTQPKTTFPLEIRFSGAQSLQAGNLYHVVFENIDTNAAQNYISIDHSVMHRGNGRATLWMNTLDWTTLFAARPTTVQRAYRWYNLTTIGSSGNYFSPIMEIGLSNGAIFGLADMESGSVDPQRTYTATASKPFREHFRPSRARSISGISVAAVATVPGSLQWRLLQNSTVLASGTIQQSTANYAPLTMHTGLRVVNLTWYHQTLPRNILLNAGQNYYLEFRPVGSSQWRVAPHRNGSYFNFKWPAAFTESNAQHLLNGGWVNTHFWNYNYAYSSGGYNWPVVLHIAP